MRLAADRSGSSEIEKPFEELGSRLAGLNVQRAEIDSRDASEGIAGLVRQRGIDLVMMPTRGLGGIRRFLLGSTTAKVLDEVECPVWTGVHPEQELAASPAEIRHVVCAIDLGPQSTRVLQWASALAADFSAQLTVLHASPQLEPVIGLVHDPEWRAHVAEALEAEIAGIQTAAGVSSTVRLESGEPAKAVCRAAAGLSADVLVIGRSAPGGVLGRLRTHSYAIIRQSPCPVVSV